MAQPLSILVIGPHPDDQELAMGGTIALLAAQGHRVTLLDLTNGEPTPFGDPATRAREAAAAAEALGAPSNPIRRIQLGLPNRRVQHTLEARHAVAGAIRAVQASVLFVPYFEDAHPDHRAATLIAEDARFDAKLTKVDMPVPPGFDAIGPPIYPKWLFHYYCTHLRLVPAPSFIIDTSGEPSAKKQRALAAYRSQFEANPANRGLPARVAQQDGYFGTRIGAAAGEPFFCREPLGLRGLGELGV